LFTKTFDNTAHSLVVIALIFQFVIINFFCVESTPILEQPNIPPSPIFIKTVFMSYFRIGRIIYRVIGKDAKQWQSAQSSFPKSE